MDDPRTLGRLRMAERHLSLGKRCIERQLGAIVKLAGAGHDIALAQALLSRFIEMQALHERARERHLRTLRVLPENASGLGVVAAFPRTGATDVAQRANAISQMRTARARRLPLRAEADISVAPAPAAVSDDPPALRRVTARRRTMRRRKARPR